MTSKPGRLSACHRHPTIPVTGFCASCLRERLVGIQSPAADHHSPPPPDLRRTKSFCSGRDFPSSAATAAASEPRRRSCEVRARSTLSDLFAVDNEKKKNCPNRKAHLESQNSGFEIREEEEEHNGEEVVRVCHGRDNEEAEEETKTMKEFIDLELRNRKNGTRDMRSFWEAASAFSEKLRKWKWKRKLRKRCSFGGNSNRNGNGVVDMTGMRVVEKPKARRLRETQSEIGECGLGRRSCDTDPRLSIDAGRISVDYYPRLSCDSRLYIDESRISVDNISQFSDAYKRLSVDPGRISVDNDSRVMFDAPRASWDGCLIGKQCHRLSPMVSLVEDDNDRVPVERHSNAGPGGSAETKDYYRGRRSFDRSSSRRRQSMAEVDELRMVSNAKVSPATTELFYGAKLLISEKDLALRNESVKSLSDVQGDCVMGSASKDDDLNVATGVSHKGLKKLHKLRRVWSKLGFVVQRREEDKLGEGECGAGGVANSKPLAESWQKLRRVVNVQASESVSQKLIRSYSVSCRNPCTMAGLISSLGGTESKGTVLNGRQEFMLQRNRSVRYSPNNLDNGLLRFYLTPLKSYRRSKSGKSSLKDLQPTARSVF